MKDDSILLLMLISGYIWVFTYGILLFFWIGSDAQIKLQYKLGKYISRLGFIVVTIIPSLLITYLIWHQLVSDR